MKTGLPAPTNSSVDRAISERHAQTIILGGLLATPVVLVVLSFVGLPIYVQWPMIAVLLFGDLLLMRLLLERSFLRKMADGDLGIRHTDRAAGPGVRRRAAELGQYGFRGSAPHVIVSGGGDVLATPSLALRSNVAEVTAIVTEHGTHLTTALSDGRWLVTSAMPVLAHVQLVVQRTAQDSIPHIWQAHDRGRELLRQRGVESVDLGLPPTDVALVHEQIEQDVIRQHLATSRGRLHIKRAARGVGTLEEGLAREVAFAS